MQQRREMQKKAMKQLRQRTTIQGERIPEYELAAPYEQLRTLQRVDTTVSTLTKHPYTTLEPPDYHETRTL